MGFSEAVDVSCGFLGLPLMLYITSFLWFVGVVPMINLSCKPNHFGCKHDVQVCVGVYEALGVSSSCLGDL